MEGGPSKRNIHTQSKICTNLRYSLEQLKLSSDKETYSKIVDSVVVGPANVKAADIEKILGVNIEIFNKSRKKRNAMIDDGVQPSWTQKDDTVFLSETSYEPNLRKSRNSSLPSIPTRHLSQIHGKRKFPVDHKRTKKTPSMVSSDLFQQFELFSKFGGSGWSRGESQITLSQSDKWLRQARVIDSWHVTTTDTAIAFRKISRGSIWLDYTAWREFLEEFTSRARLDYQQVVDRLEMCGAPSLTESTRLSASFGY